MIGCPKCGSSDLVLERAGQSLSGRPFAIFVCRFCGHRFRLGHSPPPQKAVIEQPVRCPNCGSHESDVTSTKVIAGTRRRYRKCRSCRENFYSTLPVALSDQAE